jgi:hypothetical protein
MTMENWGRFPVQQESRQFMEVVIAKEFIAGIVALNREAVRSARLAWLRFRSIYGF